MVPVQLKWFFIGCLFLGLLIGSFFIPGLPAVFQIVTVKINVLGLLGYLFPIYFFPAVYCMRSERPLFGDNKLFLWHYLSSELPSESSFS